VRSAREERLIALQARAERRRKRRRAMLVVTEMFANGKSTPKVEMRRDLHREADTLARILWQERVKAGVVRWAADDKNQRFVRVR
jgi:hypothetical protein